jgi:hypothetical protein
MQPLLSIACALMVIAGVRSRFFWYEKSRSDPNQAQERTASPEVTLLDAIEAILDAFRRHAVVAIDEPHGNEQSHAFRLSVIRDSRFHALVNDILVEFGNSRYQPVMDRFVAGEAVPYAELREVWENTTQPHTIWDRPIYEEFYRTVRALNATLPPERRLRVLLGDPPIDWETIRTPEDLQSARKTQPGRSTHPADVLIKESLSKGRRAVVVYGGLHLIRQNPQGANLIERIERAVGARTFVVLTHPFASLDALAVKHENWPYPRLALTGDSSLASQMDAVLYLGPASKRTFSRLTAALCSDSGYREMRVRRMTLSGNKNAAEQLEKECATAQ